MKLLKGRVLVGHTLKGDFKVLNYEHPQHLIRDIRKCKKYRSSSGKTMSLRLLADTFLQKVIQEGAHSSVEDARATLALYREVEAEWEPLIRQQLRTQSTSKSSPPHAHTSI